MKGMFSWFGSRLPSFSIPSLHFTDVLEILVLSFLVYELLLWIKTTKAWTLLKGLLTIVLAFIVIYLLHMDTLIYIASKGAGVIIITVVVVFQPELRRALERLGERRFISALLPLDSVGAVDEMFSDRTLNELVKGSLELAKDKTGALIVIQQKETLEEYERTGIEVDATVTSQLLINIFEKNTPLHDGAVIIRGDRVTAATCYLPLSDSDMLSKELGTRHRAAVGISESTDSFTIIVSEETGQISTAYKGNLLRDVTGDELRDQLVAIQNKSSSSKKFKLWKGWAKNETA